MNKITLLFHSSFFFRKMKITKNVFPSRKLKANSGGRYFNVISNKNVDNEELQKVNSSEDVISMKKLKKKKKGFTEKPFANEETKNNCKNKLNNTKTPNFEKKTKEKKSQKSKESINPENNNYKKNDIENSDEDNVDSNNWCPWIEKSFSKSDNESSSESDSESSSESNSESSSKSNSECPEEIKDLNLNNISDQKQNKEIKPITNYIENNNLQSPNTVPTKNNSFHNSPTPPTICGKSVSLDLLRSEQPNSEFHSVRQIDDESIIVILYPTSRLFLNGIVEVTLIAGSASIFGFNLLKQSPKVLYSSTSYCLLSIDAGHGDSLAHNQFSYIKQYKLVSGKEYFAKVSFVYYHFY